MKYAGGVIPEGVFNASIDMGDENGLRSLRVPRQCTFQQLLMFPRSDLSAKDDCDHLISKIAVVDQGVCFQ